MINCIILAGGKSTRFGENKLLQNVFNLPLIKHTINSVPSFVDRIVIVTGKYHQELKEALNGFTLIENKDYEKGMFSSVLAGLKEIEGNFYVLPGDCPFVKAETFMKLMDEDALICVPTYKGKHGHPVFFDSSLKDKLLMEDVSSSLKAFRDKTGFKEVEVDDENILNDIDYYEEYINLVETRESR